MDWVGAGVAKCGPGKEEDISLRVSIVSWEKGEIPSKTNAKIN